MSEKLKSIDKNLESKLKDWSSFKLKTEKFEKVVNKVRAFTYRVLIDEPLKPFFLSTVSSEITRCLYFVRRGVFLVDNTYKAFNFDESRATKFRKSTQSEFFLHCELIHHLYDQCALDN